MKTKIPGKIAVFSAAIVLWGGVLNVSAESIQQVFEDARAAYHQGDLVSAKAGLERVVRVDPRHSTARAYLARVNFALKQKEASGETAMQRNLAGVIVPSIEFSDATLASVIEFIPLKTAELTENKVQPSIVFKGDRGMLEQKKVTLKLANTPMTEVLRYVGEMTGVEFKYEKYAIVARPLGSEPVSAAVPTVSPGASESSPDSNPFGKKPVVDPFQ